jgi:fructose-1-phosphate kinase PfkB-like protein
VSRILVAALNPALDITHELAGVDWSGVNRPVAVSTRPGGKGLNVGRTLHALGADVLVIGLLGGPAGDAISAGLASAGVPGAFTPIAAESRRTFAVVDRDRGLAHGLVRADSWPERLRHATALGAATASAPVAGEFSRADYLRALDEVQLIRIEAA